MCGIAITLFALGEFGIVYKATMKAMNERPQEIALKTLKGTNDT